MSVDQMLARARAAERNGDRAGAAALYAAVLERFPGNARARAALDALGGGAGDPPRGDIEHLVALYRQGRLAEAATGAEAVLRRWPGSVTVLRLLGAACGGLGDMARAETAFARAAALDPANAEAQFNLAAARLALGRPADAEAPLRRAVALDPAQAEAQAQLGNVLAALDRPDEALVPLRAALALQPGRPDVLRLLGFALAGTGRQEEAVPVLREVARMAPQDAQAWSLLAEALCALGMTGDGIAACRRWIALEPASAAAHYMISGALEAAGELPEAREHAARALALQPGHALAEAWGLHLDALMCEWSRRDALDAILPRLGIEGDFVGPFSFLALDDDPVRHRLRAERCAAQVYPRPERLPARPCGAADDGRLRIGYLSADFFDHATMHLMSGLLREHDRSRFAIHAYSYGGAREGGHREAMMRHVEVFADVAALGDAEIAARVAADGIDIAVDLKGFTQYSRSAILAWRPAPVQVNYLGYPGTMGAPFIDYIVADARLIPHDLAQHYSEAVVRLPESYQPNDDRRAIAPEVPSRAALGLPENGFVFACFNHLYKLAPQVFAIWLRLLAAVPGSVLWLLRSNRWAEANLRAAAEAAGIDPARLVLAETVPHAEHLARLAHADLFLDTLPCNAHTTASDALWAGVPLVTQTGRSFAGRVATSLVHAVGLPECAAPDAHAYEALALALATDPARLAWLRARLAEGRRSAPLFDTSRYARHLEAAFEAMAARARAGLPPAAIDIAPLA